MKSVVLAIGITLMCSMAVQAAAVTPGKSYKKAKKVKVGTTLVQQPEGAFRYIKFKASKTKKYTFTVSDVACNGEYQSVYAFSGFYKKKNRMMTFKQNGKKTTFLNLTTQRNYNEDTVSTGTGANQYMPARSVSFKLKKGQSVVMVFNGSSSGTLVSYKVTIK